MRKTIPYMEFGDVEGDHGMPVGSLDGEAGAVLSVLAEP